MLVKIHKSVYVDPDYVVALIICGFEIIITFVDDHHANNTIRINHNGDLTLIDKIAEKLGAKQ